MDVSNHPIDFESMLKFSAEFSGDPIRGMSVLGQYRTEKSARYRQV